MKRQGKPDNFHPDQDVPVSRFRCWDGTIGCEQHKPEAEFRWHKMLCNQCCAATSARYGMKQSDIGYLSLLIFCDAGLYREMAYAKAPAGNIEILKRGEEGRINHLFGEITKPGMKPNEVEKRIMNYRKWFRDEAFGRREPIRTDSALPTADR